MAGIAVATVLELLRRRRARRGTLTVRRRRLLRSGQVASVLLPPFVVASLGSAAWMYNITIFNLRADMRTPPHFGDVRAPEIFSELRNAGFDCEWLEAS